MLFDKLFGTQITISYAIKRRISEKEKERMAEKALSEKVQAELRRMTSVGVISKEIQWRWVDQRQLLFGLILKHIGPELGFDASKPDNKPEVQAAWKAWCELVSDGYMVESSNGGKKFADAGFCAATPAKAKVEVGEFK